MAKISPVSIKYMIHANFDAEGALEKPDVIGAIFGQTEGLLGTDLEMRELQKEGKIGRIEVDLERNDKKTTGKIKIPTALDQSETTLIAAAIETIERIGPSDAQIDVERIEDVRGSKRDYIIDRAKKLMKEIHGTTDSREISNQIKDYSRTSEVSEYGSEKLPAGDISGREVIVVEGRADVLNLLRAGIKNVIAMNGTKLPDAIKELGKEKELTLFVDGDRGGKLIARNVVDNARVRYIAVAPDGKEVEEISGKEIWMCLRKKVPTSEFFSGRSFSEEKFERKKAEITSEVSKAPEIDESSDEDESGKLREVFEKIQGKGKAVLLDRNLKEVKSVSARAAGSALKKESNVYAVAIDGTATSSVISSAEDANVQIVAAKNFASTSDKVKLVSL
ncbi:MAG: DNA primase DnaG [archaeon]